MCRILVLLFFGIVQNAFAQGQRYYFPGDHQPPSHFIPNFHTSSDDNAYFPPHFLDTDLQTSDLPPHLQHTLPQYHNQFASSPRFVQPTVQHPVPFQLPSKSNTYLYDGDDNTSAQLPKPQPFQPTKPKQQQHSHFLTHSRNPDPQAETFLGQITLQSPEVRPDFQFRPSKEFPQWRRPRPKPINGGSKPYKELSDTVDQHLEEFIEKENKDVSQWQRYKPTYLVNNNGDVYTTSRNNFRPKSTTTTTPPTTLERRNRFHPITTTKPSNKLLPFNFKSQKNSFSAKYTTTSTTEINSDLEPLLEEPIRKQKHAHNDDEVEVIQSITSLPTTKQDVTTITTTHAEEVQTATISNKINQTSETETELETETIPPDEYYDEYEDEIEPTTKTEEITTNSFKPEEKINTTTTESEQTTTESNFDILTMKPSAITVEHDNFNDFVDSADIDTTTEESSTAETTTTVKQPVLIGGAVVSVVTTKSVVNGTFSVPTSVPEVTEQISPNSSSTSSSESWMVVASVQTSRSVSGARYLSFPIVEDDRRAQLLNESPGTEITATTTTIEPVSELKSPSPSTESISDKLDRVQSELSSSLLTGGFKDTDIITEQVPETSTTSTSTTTKPSVVIRKFSANLRPTTTKRPIRRLTNFETSKSDDLAGLLPPGYKPKYQKLTTTTTTSTSEEPQGDEPFKNNTNARSSGVSFKNKITIQDDVNAFLPPGYKPPESDPVKTLEDFLGKVRNEARNKSTSRVNSKHLQNPVVNETSSNSSNKRIENLLSKAQPVDISAFLPPGYKSTASLTTPAISTTIKTSTDKSKRIDAILAKAEPIDISSLLPPGYKPPKEDKPKNVSNLLAKAVPVDISAFLPPGYKTPKENKSKNISSLLTKAEPVDVNAFLPPGYKAPKEDKPKNVSNLLAKAVPMDISAFLPPGYKSTKEDKPKNVSNLLAKAVPVDVNAFLPPGYKSTKEDKPKNVSSLFTKIESPKSNETEKQTKQHKISDLLAEAIPVDVSKFLPPGYSGYKPKFTRKPTEVTSESTTVSTSTVSSTTTSSGGFKVVFPSRPGGRKPITRITTPRASASENPGVTAPTIHKGWPSRATTEFTGWPTPSTTPISIEKLLEAARAATSASSSTEVPTVPITTSTTTTTTTTTPVPTTPGLCAGECDLAGTIKLIGGAQWVPELLDHNTKEWQILANEVQTQLEKAYSKSSELDKWYKRVRIEEFSPGSVLVDYFVELTELGRTVDTMELKTLFNNALEVAPGPSARSIGKSENLRDSSVNGTKLELGNFLIDPQYTDFIVIPKHVNPTVGYADDNVFLPQWAIAVIVIGLASLLFVIIFGVTVLVNRQKNAKKKQPATLTEEMLNELNKNHMGGLDNYGADDLYNMEDVWNEKAYDAKPPKKRSAGSIHDNSMSNLYDSWRSEWNGYYYNAYYGNNPGSSSNSGFQQRRRSDYDTNF